MMKYEVQEMIFKPKVKSNLETKTDEIVFDVEIHLFLEFDDGRRTPQQFRSFTIGANELDKINQRIIHPLIEQIVGRLIKYIKEEKVNLADVVQLNKKIFFRVSSLKPSEITYMLI